MVADGCQYGVTMIRANIRLRYAEIKNSTVRPFSLDMSSLALAGSLIGTGNTGHGLNASGVGNTVKIEGFTPTITGASGDATVDGTTALTWATDFPASGDFAADVASGARIYRS
jgi:allophanate hydrolase subunit 2